MRAIRDKGIRVRELQTLDRKRAELCLEAGFVDGPEQMSAFTDWCDANEEIAHSWGQLIELAHACSTMNLTNGAVIRMRKQQVEDGICLLRGRPTGTNTYNRDGARRDGAGHRAIAEA
jgi:flagellar biosynthesis/type III secretory pathway chaperone